MLKDDIRRCAAQCESTDEFSWLLSEVIYRQLGSAEGIMCELRRIPEQGGVDWEGLWLSETRRFFQFSVQSPYDGSDVEIEEWEEVTVVLPNNAHTPIARIRQRARLVTQRGRY